MTPEQARSVLVVGFGVTGRACARALLARGHEVVVVDDSSSAELASAAQVLGVRLVVAPDDATLAELVGAADALLPAPGLPDAHPAFALAAEHGVPVLSELDLADWWDDRPLVAITGTDGKTTVTHLVQWMLEASGVRAVQAGNTDVPLVEAIDDPLPDTFVVEASSFRLGRSASFHPKVATWLNFGEDHLDVHSTLDGYIEAKARIWSEQGPGDTAVANAEDPVVMARVPRHGDGPDLVTFGLAEGDFTLDGDVLVARGGERILEVSELRRTLPHDIANALAASATALAGGASMDGVREVLRGFEGLPHRVQLVGERDGVRWIDDSKSTAPHATLAALRGFDSVVLLAGGHNKGLDLSVLAEGRRALAAVVGIGDAGPSVVAALPGLPSALAGSMREAVEAAASLAHSGDVVLLSPACASFDWYRSYGERGRDFTQLVRELVLEAT